MSGMSTGAELLDEVRARGVELQADGERILFRPAQAVPPELVERMRGHKQELLAQLAAEAAEIAWRVEVLRPHVAPRGPVWLPPVRPDAPYLRDAPGRCCSCGEPRPASLRFICAACAASHRTVLLEVREQTGGESEEGT
jgi:TubC N-terminal docking domain